jgi:outer membrane receptor protein involved in Fe transport
VFAGAVRTPLGRDGPRLAVDFSRIRKSDDIFIFTSFDIVMAHEDFWPQRVTRGPLTDADRARGYTGGPVTVLDLRATNGASLLVDALDVQAEWPLPLLSGRLRLYADATHQLNNRQQELFEPAVHYAGYLNGPLKWRANGGFDWSKDPLTVGANLQYFSRSLVLQAAPTSLSLDAIDAQEVRYQGSRYIPSQLYLDLHAGWRLPVRAIGHAGDLAFELGVINVLDKAPPRVSSLLAGGPGYSRYGDARQRRFELTLSAHF